MIQKQKSFCRRPWHSDDSGLVKCFSQINVEDVEDRGIHLCFHTAASFLKQDGIECSDPNGFYWPELSLRNFSIKNVRNGDALFINDGVIGETLFNLTLADGKITDLVDSNAITLDHLNLDVLTLSDLLIKDKIKISNCKINKIIITNSTLDITLLNTKVEYIELWNSIVLGLPMTLTPRVFPSKKIAGLRGSLAVNVVIDGVVYTASASSLILIPVE